LTAISEVDRLLGNGDKTAAIKAYRVESGIGLFEAKMVVESWQANRVKIIDSGKLVTTSRDSTSGDVKFVTF
jgi:ribosomal protein L7/L12